MKVAIIGAGLIGQKRARSLDPTSDTLLWVCDQSLERAEQVARSFGAKAVCEPGEILRDREVEAVVIATTHDSLASITRDCFRHEKAVLVEKPAARNAHEIAELIEEYKRSGKRFPIKVGFNHRFHPAMLKARDFIDQGGLGDPMFIRGRYGHGGRIGYEQEWRARPQVSGGGELLDQGMHLIDLSRWYFGDFPKVFGLTKTLFWNMPVDDNAFLTLETTKGQVAHLQVTWTEWKNLFSLEIYGKQAKVDIFGLGGSYGPERITIYRMKSEMGPPAAETFEFPGADASFGNEWQSFKDEVKGVRTHIADLEDAFEALKIVDRVYQQNGFNFNDSAVATER